MKKTWWKEAVIYQIYPRSFMDSDGDGIGDLQGINSRLEYLADLGVDVLWLSPIFKSPNDDNGYDISNYCDIMDEFGTMHDFDDLLENAHRLGLKIILDLVVNHSSDEHPWFQESRSSRDNAYRDYYIWRDEKPSDWPAFFGGDAWEYDEETNAYYLHLFTKKQPDLNWENPRLRKEIYQLMRFWLDKGVDGFRMDVIPLISKRLDFPEITDNDFKEVIKKVYANGPRLHEFLQEMNTQVSSKYKIMTLGEGIGVDPGNCLLYTDESRKELNMIYHFEHMTLDWGEQGKFEIDTWKLSDFKRIFSEWDTAIEDKGWINVFLDNHDFPRMVSRFGNDEDYWEESAKLLAVLILTMRGTPCIYQGSEIGMTNVKYSETNNYRDIESLNFIENFKGDQTELLKILHHASRDNARTPMQWDATKNAGFSEGIPWIGLNRNHEEINVESAISEGDSIFYFYKKLLWLRKSNSTLIYGAYKDLCPDDEYLFFYERSDEKGRYLILLNMSNTVQEIKLEVDLNKAKLLISNLPENQTSLTHIGPWAARVFKY